MKNQLSEAFPLRNKVYTELFIHCTVGSPALSPSEMMCSFNVSKTQAIAMGTSPFQWT